MAESINWQADREKPELQRLGIGREGVRAVFTLEPEISGVGLFSVGEAAGEFYRNAFGSELMEFVFDLVAVQAPQEDEARCDLPIARHGHEARMLISHQSGKKSFTEFRRLGRRGRYTMWEARTRFPRLHQIALHGREVGIVILAEGRYSLQEPFHLFQIHKQNRNVQPGPRDRALFEGAAIHLREIRGPRADGGEFRIAAEPPRRFKTLLKQIERYA